MRGKADHNGSGQCGEVDPEAVRRETVQGANGNVRASRGLDDDGLQGGRTGCPGIGAVHRIRHAADRADLRDRSAHAVMHTSPRTIRQDALAVDAAELMEQHGITSVLVADAGGVLQGIVHIGDLMRAKVI